MPGVVMKVCVAVGQQVAKDQVLVVLEAMKMESPVSAPSAGTVASILVREADAVVEGQVLIHLS
jgi:glutaconyl-CoA/methylmalonyl-CoA decarboxylase subunit gamma